MISRRMSWDSPDAAWEALAEQARAAEALRPVPTDRLAAALHDGGRGVLVVRRRGQIENARTWGERRAERVGQITVRKAGYVVQTWQYAERP